MQTTIELDAKEIAQMGLQRYLRTAQGRARELYPVWDKVLDILYEAERQLFAKEGQTKEHSKWEELSPRYAAWKKKHYPGMPIMTLTGRFRGSMTDPSGTHHVEKRSRSLAWGSHYPVSGRHDLGGIHAEGRRSGFAGYLRTGTHTVELIETSATKHTSYMPARPPIRITQGNVDDIADIVVDYILDFDLSRPRQAWEIGY